MTFKDIFPGLSRTSSFNFQDFPGPKWFSRTFQVLEFSRKKNPGLSRRRGNPINGTFSTNRLYCAIPVWNIQYRARGQHKHTTKHYPTCKPKKSLSALQPAICGDYLLTTNRLPRRSLSSQSYGKYWQLINQKNQETERIQMQTNTRSPASAEKPARRDIIRREEKYGQLVGCRTAVSWRREY